MAVAAVMAAARFNRIDAAARVPALVVQALSATRMDVRRRLANDLIQSGLVRCSNNHDALGFAFGGRRGASSQYSQSQKNPFHRFLLVNVERLRKR